MPAVEVARRFACANCTRGQAQSFGRPAGSGRSGVTPSVPCRRGGSVALNIAVEKPTSHSYPNGQFSGLAG